MTSSHASHPGPAHAPELSVEPHAGGWAIKHGDSFLGVTAQLADALTVMAALADNTPGPARANSGHRLRVA